MSNGIKQIAGEVYLFIILSYILSGCSNPEDYLNKGNEFFKNGDYENAVIEYQKAIKKEPNFAEAYYQIGSVKQSQNNVDEALANFKKVIEVDPKYIKAYIKLGEIYINKGNLDEAEKLLRTADNVNPNNTEILSLWATVLSKKMKKYPSDESIYLTLGEIYEKELKYEDASVQYSKALKINPRSDVALFRLAKTLELKKDYLSAIDKYRNIRKDSPLFTQAQQRISDIQEMQGYKGAIWGMNPVQVSKSLHTSLLKENYGIAIGGLLSGAFYEIWGVPKKGLGELTVYDPSYLPEESFRTFTTSQGDKCLFYKGKFCCYYFKVEAANYDAYYNTMVSKYGEPVNKSFTVFSVSPSNFTVHLWQKGSTKILMFKEDNEGRFYSGFGYIEGYTQVGIAYCSNEIFKQIEDVIQERVAASNKIEEHKEKQQIEEDLEKIQ